MGYGDEIINTFLIEKIAEKYPDKKIGIASAYKDKNTFTENNRADLSMWMDRVKLVYKGNPHIVHPRKYTWSLPENDLSRYEDEDLIIFRDIQGTRWVRRAIKIYNKEDKSPFFIDHRGHNKGLENYLPYVYEKFGSLIEDHYRDKNGLVKWKMNPGIIYFMEDELKEIEELKSIYSDHIFIHPYACKGHNCADWGLDNWTDFIKKATRRGHKLVQCGPAKNFALANLHNFSNSSVDDIQKRNFEHLGVTFHETQNFRDAMKLIAAVKMVITPEGGIHHASAALNKSGVILLGGRVHPDAFGYDFQCNIYVKDKTSPCIITRTNKTSICKKRPCHHCSRCWKKINFRAVLKLIETRDFANTNQDGFQEDLILDTGCR